MRSAKVKKMEEMELQDLKGFNNFTCVGFLVMNLMFSTLLIVNDKAYVNVAKVTLIMSIILSVLIMVSNRDEKKRYLVGYIYTGLNSSLGAFSMYLSTCNKVFMPESMIANVLIFLNFIIVIGVCFFRRIIVKNKKYIDSVKTGKNDIFFIKDAIVSIVISIILIFIAKVLDVNSFYITAGKLDVFICGIGIIGLSIILGPLNVNGMAMYLYKIKYKK